MIAKTKPAPLVAVLIPALLASHLVLILCISYMQKETVEETEMGRRINKNYENLKGNMKC